MTRRRARDLLGHAVAGAAGPILIRALARTLRVRRAGEDHVARARSEGGVLFALWHGRMTPFIAAHRDRGIVGLVSEHRDGEYIARMLTRLGFGVVRGSTTRGGTRALFDMAQRAREGRDLAITPDGPHGPSREVRPGVLALARRAGVVVVPVGVAAGGIRLPTWDRFLVPTPFARAAVVYAEPVRPAGADGADLETESRDLARRIQEATARAEAMVAQPGVAVAAYRLATGAAEVLAAPLLALRARGRDTTWRSRLGRIDGAPRGAVWMHAASVGETLGVEPFAAALRRAIPETPVVLSTMTPTGLAVAGTAMPEFGARFLVPFDFPGAMRRTFDALSPRALILMETELWPNMIAEAHARGIPVAILNARLSTRAWPRYRAARALFAGLLGRVSWIAAQSEADRARFVQLGAPSERVETIGSTKGDARGDAADRDATRRRLGLAARDRVLVFGSARTAEDPIFLDVSARLLARFDDLRILYAPRHVERAPAVRDAMRARLAPLAVPGEAASLAADPNRLPPENGECALLSAWRSAPAAYRFLVVDTIGELRALYSAADVAVVGGSWSGHGGHNPLEPASAGVPVVMGPDRDNVASVFDRLRAAGGAEQAITADDLVQSAARLLSDPAERRRRGDALRDAAGEGAGVADRLVHRLRAHAVLP
jgi:3-deoxy-D-manno-octulosonic-acid transferase